MPKRKQVVVSFISLLTILILTWVGNIVAQDDILHDFPLPACTTAEVQAAYELLRESQVTVDLEESLQAFSDVDNFVTGYAELVLIRNTYYLDVQPHLEDCRAIWQFDLMFGDYLTNITLNVGNLIIGILSNDVAALTTLTEPMQDTMPILRNEYQQSFVQLALLAGVDLSDNTEPTSGDIAPVPSTNSEIFTSEEYPNGIIGPIQFNGTLYQVTLSSSASGASVSTTVIQGDCERRGPTIMTDIDGTPEADLWEPGGDCIAMFDVQRFGSSHWTLEFERLR